MVIGRGNVCFTHKSLAASPDAFRDEFFCELAQVGEHQNVEVEEATCDHQALPERILGCFFALLHVFDARAGAIVVVIELVECPEVATEAERPLRSI